jgi:hypothetical protein
MPAASLADLDHDQFLRVGVERQSALPDDRCGDPEFCVRSIRAGLQNSVLPSACGIRP